MRTWKVASLVIATALVSMTVVGAMARPNALPPDTTGTGITLVKIATGEVPVGTSAQTWTNVYGARAVIKVPKGTKAIIDARFASWSDCYATSGTPTGYCMARILIGKAQGLPFTGDMWAEVLNGVGDHRGVRAMEQSRGPLSPGVYTVQVQHETGDPDIYFSLHGFHLTVERITAQ